MRTRYVPFLPTVLIVLLLGALPSFCCAQVQVGATTSVDGSGDPAQRKVFSVTNGEQWAFFFDGTAIQYRSSTDGVVWSGSSSLPYATSDFSLIYRGIGGMEYVFVVLVDGFDVVLLRGVVGPGIVAFDPAVTVFDGTSAVDRYQSVTVSVSGSDYVWVAALSFGDPIVTSTFKQIVARRSTLTGNQDLSSWQATTQIGKRDASTSRLVLVPRTGDSMYLVASGLSDNVVGFDYNGSVWSDGNAGGDLGWFKFAGNIFDGAVTSVAVVGDATYVGGTFIGGGGNTAVNRVGMWRDSTWNALGTGVNNTPWAVTVVGTNIYFGGLFTNAGGNTDADGVAMWNGSGWSALGTGIPGTVFSLSYYAGLLYSPCE